MKDSIKDLKNKYENDELALRRKTTIFAVLRLIGFVLTIVFLILASYNKVKVLYYVYYPLMALALIAFIIFVVIHYKLYHRLDNTLFKLAVIQDYDSRTNDNWKHFEDKGQEFLDENAYYQTDLDLYGASSLYQYLNVGKTGYGRRALALLLKDSDVTKEEIILNQEAVLELSNDIESHIELEALLREYNKKSNDNRPKSMDNALLNISNQVSEKKYGIYIATLGVIAVVATIILSLPKVIPYVMIPIIVFINFLLTVFVSSNIREISSNLVPINKLFNGYGSIISYINNKSFKSSKLNDIKAKLTNENKRELKKFNIINNLVSSSNNIIFQLIFDGLFSIDAFVSYFYIRWQKKGAESLKEIVSAVGEMEGLLSLSILPIVKEKVALPHVTDSFEFEGLYHPLIKEDISIPNDFKFKGLNIVTGSNMSGKTTFMRTIGINYLLFKAGGMVCASSFNADLYKLYTSMKVTDDVSNGISTFYGEILRIKEIVNAINDNDKLLVLIDEIFKGTNTIDRLEGAKAVVSKLNRKNINAIITTHDFELCQIEGVKNYHFLEHYVDDKIMFDYKIHDGVSKTRNAIYLLKLAGIMDK
ncbi:MAG: hypothetical protein ACI35W_05660 [Anaeroplasmataceae bacterium]